MTTPDEAKSRKILIVDDDETVRMSIRHFLEDADFLVTEATNGQDGLDTYHDIAPDIVILDLRMPVLSGFEVLERLDPGANHIPVIVVSGTGEIAEAARALHLGACDYLVKPLTNMNVLVHAINRALNEADMMKERENYQRRLEEEVAARTRDLQLTNETLSSINKNLRRIVEITRQSQGCPSMHECVDRFLEEVKDHLGVTGGSLYLVREDALELIQSLDPGHATPILPFPPPPDTIMGHVIRTGQPVLSEDITREKLTLSGSTHYRNTSCLVFPMLDDDGNMRAVACLHNKQDPPFTPQDLEFAQIVSAYRYQTLRTAQANEALRQSVQRYQLLAENQNDVVLALENSGRIQYCSPAITAFGGYTSEQVMGTMFDEYFQEPGQVKKATHTVRKILVSLHPMNLEFLFKPAAGDPFWVEISITPVITEGKTTLLHAVMRNISERKAAEAKLLLQHQALEQSIDGIAITDTDCRIIQLNTAWADIHNIPKADLLGRNLRFHFPNDDLLAAFNSFIQRLDTDAANVGLLHHMTARGDVIPCRVSCSKLADPEGHASGFVWIARDISREMELQERLRQSQKLESLGRLAGGIAHDFNNLLTPILSYSEFLMDEFPDGDLRKGDLLEIQRAAGTARDLVKQLLAFSRKQVLSLNVLDLNEVLDELSNIIRRTIRKNVRIDFELSGEPCLINADKAQLHQIVLNLCINAQDAMPDGGELRLRTEVRRGYKPPESGTGVSTPMDAAVIHVVDNGTGMDAATLERIFEPFYTTKQIGRGTGLGLAMVQGIVDQHEGFIRVRSEPRMGTEIEVAFPLYHHPPEEPRERQSAVSRNHEMPVILLVEDDDGVLNLLKRILQSQGYPLFTADTPSRAISIARTHPEIEMVITDVMLPEMNGHQLYESLKIHISNLKVVYISGYAQEILGEYGLLNPDTVLIEKPFSPSDFLARIRDTIERR